MATPSIATPPASPTKNTNGSASLTAISSPSRKPISGITKSSCPIFTAPISPNGAITSPAASAAALPTIPKLIGYFYTDCPLWVHTRPGNKWKGPLFDPKAHHRRRPGRAPQTRHALSTRSHTPPSSATIRHHLILGDRYEATAPIAEEVVAAAKPFVDVLEFQHFAPAARVEAGLRTWRRSRQARAPRGSCGPREIAQAGAARDGAGYAEPCAAPRFARLRRLPLVRSVPPQRRIAKRRLRNATGQPDTEVIEAITQANREASKWFSTQGNRQP